MKLSVEVSLKFREALQNDNFPLIKKSLLALYRELPQLLSEELLQEDEVNVDTNIIKEMSDNVSTYTSLLECKNSWDYVVKKFFDLCEAQGISIPTSDTSDKTKELEESMKVVKTKNLNEALEDNMELCNNMDEGTDNLVVNVSPTFAKTVKDHKKSRKELAKMWKDLYKDAKKNGFKEPLEEERRSFYADAYNALLKVFKEWRAYFTDFDDFIDKFSSVAKDVYFYDEDNHDDLTEAVDEADATSEEETEAFLKKYTDDYTKASGAVRTYYRTEKDNARKILRQHYGNVEVSDGRQDEDDEMNWVLAFSRPKKD